MTAITMGKVRLLTVALLHLINLAVGSNEEGLKFLEENAKKPGVVTLPSGLQYKVLRHGSGKYHPTVSTPCLCHYEGKLLDGTKFDSSYDRGDPTTFAPNQVIKGWTEIMQMMVEGDKWELYVSGCFAVLLGIDCSVQDASVAANKLTHLSLSL
jgi:FKBP-type peptidyl-prolyl cis-trans isomerase/Domain amino terminal to FKBP-type peptidyl-prolyl isomerase